MDDGAAIDISTDPARLDVALIHRFLSTQTDWACGISRATVARSIAHSVCVGAYLSRDGAAPTQVGFARVVTDRATFAYLCDVFVLEEQRGLGIGKQLVEAVVAHPALQGLRRFMLATSTAAPLYRRYGFEPVPGDNPLMQIHRPGIYQAATQNHDD